MRIVGPLLVALAVGCAAPPPTGSDEEDFSIADTAEDTVLPFKGAWLDAPRALSGIGQFDRLKGTVHDDAKCSTMVAVSAAIVGGKERFLRFLGEVERLRADHRSDVAVVERVRGAVEARTLTPRHIHELTEVVVRAYGVADGAYDGQISRMVRASGYTIVRVGSTRPAALVDSLEPNEVVPLATIADNEAHITLLWKDAAGTVRLYDSDDIHGSHVLPRGSSAYAKRVGDPRSEWALGEKYR